MKFVVSVPITGFNVYEVDSESEEKAKEQVLEGDNEVKRVDVEEDADSNNYVVEKV